MHTGRVPTPLLAGVALAVLGVFVPAGRLAAAVSDYIGRPVVSVQLQMGGEVLRDSALAQLIETEVGAPLAMQHVREGILHLISLGRFQDIQVEARLVDGGVALAYRLVPLSVVERVVFRGELGLSEGVLRREVTDRFGVSPPVGRAGEVAESLVAFYRDRGYMQAEVAPFAGALGSQVLIFDVVAGTRARIGTVTLEGRSLVSQAQLFEQLGVAAGETYDRAELDRRIASHVEGLRALGRYEATVEQSAVVRDDRETIDLLLDVRPGPVVTVTFEGDPLPPGLQEELVPVREEGSVDEDLLDDSSRRVADFLQEQGYWKATVDYRRVPVGDELTVTFVIRRGPRYLVERIEIVGNESVAEPELRSLLNLEPGAPFVESQLEADAATIRDYYRGFGFANAAVTVEVPEEESGSLERALARGPARVSPRIVIAEDVRILIETVGFTGNDSIEASVLSARIRSVAGSVYYRPRVLADQDAVLLEYLDRGYREASVDVNLRAGEDRSRVDLVFAISEGPQVLVDHIIVVGNHRTDRELIERELLLAAGRPLGLSDVIESQRRLRALGLFRRVIIGELVHTDRATRDVLVTVEEALATSLGYGGGLEAGRRLRRSAEAEGQAEERLEFAPRGFFEIGRRNLWGKNRSIDLFMRASVRRDDDVDPAQDGQGFGLNEYRVLGTYREPRLFGWSGDALATGVWEQAIRSSFSFIRRGLDAEVSQRLSSDLTLSGRYSLSRTRLFDERINPEDQLLVDRLFPRVRLSRFSGILVRDTRPDPLDPDRGILVGVDAELAGRAIGSQVGFAKTLVQGFVYRRLPGRRRVVVAVGGRLGLAAGFPREVQQTDEEGNPVVGADGQPVVEVVDDIPASERFFAGGDTTVRGFALDRLGDEATIDQDGFPKGGHGLVVFNAEVRVPVWGDIGAVGFLDAGNVFADVSDIDLAKIRGAVGFGIRYQSPIGPIRVDLGVKLDRRRFENGAREQLTALHVSIGQAF